MKERPILFTPENAQRCHDGTKTQTRRIVNPQPNVVHGWNGRYLETNQIFRNGQPGLLCPYGVVGDRLWCREAFSETREGSFIYKGWPMFDGMEKQDWKWTPAIHMPRSACRTVLELTGVRVERLHSISEEDAMAEGVEWQEKGLDIGQWTHDGQSWFDYAIDCYRHLYESINGPGSWDANPWVWVLEFKRVTHG